MISVLLGGVLRVAVADQEPEAAAGVIEVTREVAGNPGHPWPARRPRHAEEMDDTSLHFDDEQHVVAAERTVSMLRKSVATMAFAWERRNSDQVGPSRRGADLRP